MISIEIEAEKMILIEIETEISIESMKYFIKDF